MVHLAQENDFFNRKLFGVENSFPLARIRKSPPYVLMIWEELAEEFEAFQRKPRTAKQCNATAKASKSLSRSLRKIPRWKKQLINENWQTRNEIRTRAD